MRRLYPGAQRVVAVSEGVARALREGLGVPAERIEVIGNPVVTPRVLAGATHAPTHPWFHDGGPPVVVGVGRLAPQKGFDVLLRAVAQARAARPCRLLILGDGGERAALEALADTLGIRDAVALPGFDADPFPAMAAAGAFVLSSAWEGLPNVLIQAMALGTPVVATDCPSGPAEVTDGGRLGRLVPVGDVAAMADGIVAALGSGRRPMDAAWLARYAPERIASRYEDVLGLPKRVSATTDPATQDPRRPDHERRRNDERHRSHLVRHDVVPARRRRDPGLPAGPHAARPRPRRAGRVHAPAGGVRRRSGGPRHRPDRSWDALRRGGPPRARALGARLARLPPRRGPRPHGARRAARPPRPTVRARAGAGVHRPQPHRGRALARARVPRHRPPRRPDHQRVPGRRRSLRGGGRGPAVAHRAHAERARRRVLRAGPGRARPRPRHVGAGRRRLRLAGGGATGASEGRAHPARGGADAPARGGPAARGRGAAAGRARGAERRARPRPVPGALPGVARTTWTT